MEGLLLLLPRVAPAVVRVGESLGCRPSRLAPARPVRQVVARLDDGPRVGAGSP